MKVLKEWFQKNGVKQSYVAKEIGVSRQTLNYWINKESFPISESIIKLSMITGIRIEELLGVEKLFNNNNENNSIKIISSKNAELESTIDFQSIDNFFDKLKAENAAAFDDDIS